MKQEDKKLLLVDLCARLPYGVKCHFKYGSAEDDITLSCIDNNVARFEYGWHGSFHVSINADYIKPYLRPMSSMTEEEKEQTRDLWIDADTKTHATRLIDFYNKHHFDYRGLIEKCLALKAPEGMYGKEE